MHDSLSAIFKDGLFTTKKNPNRDWTQISDKAGNHLYAIVCEEFTNPEVALCALIHSLAEVVLCQTEKAKRDKLVKCIPDALLECAKRIEENESDEPYEYEGGEEEEGDEEPEDEGPLKPGQESEGPEDEPEEEEQEEVDFKAKPLPKMADNTPDRPSPEPEEDDDFPLEDDDPDESTFNNNPARLAGFKKKPPGGKRK